MPIDSQFSQNNTINSKVLVDNALNTIKDGIGKLSDAVQDFGKTASLKIQSAFKAADLPKKNMALGGSNAKTPEDAKQDMAAAKFAGAKIFPANMKYYALFSFYEYERPAPNQPPTQKGKVSIALPMPSSLQESFAVDYATPEVGPIVGSLADGITNAMRENSSGSALATIGTAMSNAATNAGSAAKDATSVAVIKGAKSLGPGGETASVLASQAIGAAPNPHVAVLFQNISLRTHSFSYKFAPRSRGEMDTLKDIIKTLKKSMLPGLSETGALFTFPYLCDIQFLPNKNSPFKILECVMTDMQVNYSPNGSPAFFKTGDPVMVEITMSFKEIKPFTRKEVE